MNHYFNVLFLVILTLAEVAAMALFCYGVWLLWMCVCNNLNKK